MTPLWKYLPAQWSHDIAPFFLHAYSRLAHVKDSSKDPLEWRGIRFPNRMGVAAGVDKLGINAIDWQKLGAGFVEIGTVTPRPQRANPKPILMRNWQTKSIWNKMGFPSPGAKNVRETLRTQLPQKKIPWFINIGRNRNTDNENAASDYAQVAQELLEFADVFVINISSPNTAGLRDLQTSESIEKIVSAVKKNSQETPLLLKLSPDISDEKWTLLEKSLPYIGIDGLIMTNTTTWRPKNSAYPLEGGLSGQPLAEKSRACLLRASRIKHEFKSPPLIVSVGGIDSKLEMDNRLKLGADLIQVYSSLVFEGPGFFAKSLNERNTNG
jgi:dihydroorotate dehydrogenase